MWGVSSAFAQFDSRLAQANGSVELGSFLLWFRSGVGLKCKVALSLDIVRIGEQLLVDVRWKLDAWRGRKQPT